MNDPSILPSHSQASTNPSIQYDNCTAKDNQQSSSHSSNNSLQPPVVVSTTSLDDLYRNTKQHVATAPVVAPFRPTYPSSIMSSSNVPEFLYQLTKMLTENNKSIIEWTEGQIEVHDPHRLETEVLQRYFRHNKFASFQRQLNYFGFRKIAGKGRMAPCSYVNEAVKGDLNNLIHIKRKTPANQVVPVVRDRASARIAQKYGTRSSTGALQRPRFPTDDDEDEVPAPPRRRSQPSSAVTSNPRPAQAPRISSYQSTGAEQQAARSAVGRGIRHAFRTSATPPSKENNTMVRNDSLLQLAQNYQSAFASQDEPTVDWSGIDPTLVGDLPDEETLSRTNSLVDLALLTGDATASDNGPAFDFVDFPYEELRPDSHDNE